MGCFAAGMYAKRPAERTGASSRILLKRIGRERERKRKKKVKKERAAPSGRLDTAVSVCLVAGKKKKTDVAERV